MDESSPARIIIVGGGIGGLTAARDLAVGGARVTVLEASAVLGGKVARHSVAGIELDAGAESFATRRDMVRSFADGLGLGDEIAQPNPAGAWLQRAEGGAVPLPKAGLLGIPSTPLAADVIAVVGLRAALRAQLDSLLAYRGAKERTLGGLVRARMGTAVLDKLVAPITLGVHSRHPDDLDVDVVAPGLRAALLSTVSLAQAVQKLRAAAPAGSAVAGIEGGIFRLVEALAARLERLGVEVRTNTRVTAIEADRVTLASGEVIEADRVVLACNPEESEAGIVLATLVVRSPRLDAAPRGTGLLVAPAARGIRAKALTHATAKWPWLAARVESGTHVLRLSYDAAAAPSDLSEQATADAANLLGVTIEPEQVLGFDRVQWAKPAKRYAAPSGVTVIGETVAGAGLAAVIGQARRESGSLLTDLAQ
ncbi:protoporphyrinogen/coproporphyrinogen oxidase [Parafrigoribacterium soli]|uniref:protoporphyrinogen/coproporphyrinogen oxidase n=1 Tax=Parafrigoribacterium soli TaxID=3144663 RepID=UPI0032EF52D8